ncbi:MAG: hypothetical protein SRB1_00408 [Desulfobacteraceae bacterium Eth-SRB1]|nr:MAG: hypothetical protein SRB1_00408 [Desulfobacteraceae bacterium Eth-SRB1]
MTVLLEMKRAKLLYYFKGIISRKSQRSRSPGFVEVLRQHSSKPGIINNPLGLVV